MFDVFTSGTFDKWFAGLRDAVGKSAVLARIARLRAGNPGDVKPVGEGVSEMRINVGPGYRVYFIRRGETVAVLLVGGSKAGQAADIVRAKQLASEWE